MSTSNFFWEKYYFYVLGIILCNEHVMSVSFILDAWGCPRTEDPKITEEIELTMLQELKATRRKAWLQPLPKKT